MKCLKSAAEARFSDPPSKPWPGRRSKSVQATEDEGMFCTHDVTLATQEELIARLVVVSCLLGSLANYSCLESSSMSSAHNNVVWSIINICLSFQVPYLPSFPHDEYVNDLSRTHKLPFSKSPIFLPWAEHFGLNHSEPVLATIKAIEGFVHDVSVSKLSQAVMAGRPQTSFTSHLQSKKENKMHQIGRDCLTFFQDFELNQMPEQDEERHTIQSYGL